MAYLTRLALLAVLAGGGVLTGCGDDYNNHVACTTAAECGLPTDMTTAECCGGFCMAVSAGCDSGYRFLTTEPGFGECVVDPMCPAPPADMAVPIDMAKKD